MAAEAEEKQAAAEEALAATEEEPAAKVLAEEVLAGEVADQQDAEPGGEEGGTLEDTQTHKHTDTHRHTDKQANM